MISIWDANSRKRYVFKPSNISKYVLDTIKEDIEEELDQMEREMVEQEIEKEEQEIGEEKQEEEIEKDEIEEEEIEEEEEKEEENEEEEEQEEEEEEEGSDHEVDTQHDISEEIMAQEEGDNEMSHIGQYRSHSGYAIRLYLLFISDLSLSIPLHIYFLPISSFWCPISLWIYL